MEMKYRKYDNKHYSHMSAICSTFRPYYIPNNDMVISEKFTGRDIVILSKNIGDSISYILEEKLYENEMLFTAHPSTFNEDFLYECFSKDLLNNTDALLMAIKTQDVSEGFIRRILNIIDYAKSDDELYAYYNILHIASGYVDLSEEFIKEYILEDSEVSESTLINVLQLQKLSEQFIEENLIDFLDCKRIWEHESNQECYGWNFLFGNANATISQDFFERHNLMKLNLAEVLFFQVTDQLGDEYAHIDLSSFKFNYLYKIFAKACNDATEVYEKFCNYEISIFTSFESFGIDFIKKIMKNKMHLKSFHDNIKSLFSREKYYFDSFIDSVFDSFLFDESDIDYINEYFGQINENITTLYINDEAYHISNFDFCYCWFKCIQTQKVSPELLKKIVQYYDCHKKKDGGSYLSNTYFIFNRYMTEDHVKILNYLGKFNLADWLDCYEFDFNTGAFKSLTLDNYSMLSFDRDDLINYCNFIFESCKIVMPVKVKIFANIMQYQSHHITSDTYEYFVSYIDEMVNTDPQLLKRCVGLLLSCADIDTKQVLDVLKRYEINL